MAEIGENIIIEVNVVVKPQLSAKSPNVVEIGDIPQWLVESSSKPMWIDGHSTGATIIVDKSAQNGKYFRSQCDICGWTSNGYSNVSRPKAMLRQHRNNDCTG